MVFLVSFLCYSSVSPADESDIRLLDLDIILACEVLNHQVSEDDTKQETQIYM
jgi:hypothetical protein